MFGPKSPPRLYITFWRLNLCTLVKNDFLWTSENTEVITDELFDRGDNGSDQALQET